MTATRDYTTVALVKTAISVRPNTVTDVGLLDSIVKGVTQSFRSMLNREILSTEYTEVYDGTGTNTLCLPNYPVSRVWSLEVGPPGGRTALVENTSFIAGKFAVKRLDGIFPEGVANVAIRYTAGFAELPLDIQLAATKVAALRYKQLDRLGQTSKSMGGESVNFDTSDLPKDVMTVINNYTRRVPI